MRETTTRLHAGTKEFFNAEPVSAWDISPNIAHKICRLWAKRKVPNATLNSHNIGQILVNIVSLKCVDVSISVESINRDDNINDCEVNFNANISDNVINVFKSCIKCIF